MAIDESRIGHIFRQARGHFHEDTPANRRTLLDVAVRRTNYVGTDRFGNDWFAADHTGRQIWVHVRDGRITNGQRDRAQLR
jgi:filamentous hemagglutinin